MKGVKNIVMAFFAIFATMGCAQEVDGTYTNVDVTEFNNLIGSGNGILLDVRTEEEFIGGHIEGATNVVYSMFGFSGNVSKLNKDTTYYIYCRSGGRSGKSLNIMKKKGFKKVYNLNGGLMGWKSSGMPIVK